MAPEKFSEKEMVDISEDLASAKTESNGLSRRKFNRNVLVGSAVLLTLSNRSAWGVPDPNTLCFSTNVLMSYENGQASWLTDTTDIDNFIATRDNYKIPGEPDSYDNRRSYRDGPIIENENSETCFPYKK
jgi:hypothetical protein